MSDIQIITACWSVVIIYILSILRNLYIGKYRSETNYASSIVVITHLCCITICIVILNIYPIGIVAFSKSIF